MQYRIINATSANCYDVIEECQKKVNKLCKNGWRPQGGVCITETRYGYSTFYRAYQAIVKKG